MAATLACTTMGKTIAITGVSGYLGQRLLDALEKDPDVERIVGTDVAAPAAWAAKVVVHRLNKVGPGLADVWKGVDTVVHLAFVVNPMRDDRLMHEINVGGFRNVLDAVAATGVRKFVYTSSVSAYGAHPDNPVPLTEDSPLRANPEFNYAEHKAETEEILDGWQKEHPEVLVTVLRPAIVFGPHVSNFISRTLEAPRFLAVKGYSPPLQVVHEDDVASALRLCVQRDLPGVYNCAADGAIEQAEVLALAGKKRLEIDEDTIVPLATAMWKLGLSETPPGEVNFLMYPYVISNAKLQAAGWTPRSSNREALLATFEANRDYVTIGTVRMRRQDLRRRVLTGSVALTAAGVVAVALAARLLRRR